MEEKATMTFTAFLEQWNTQQNLKTPEIHKRIAEWLEAQWIEGKKRILLMAFRSAGKSTIVGVFSAWLLYRDPNIRILVLAADMALAKKLVRNVKRIIERHQDTSHLRPTKADQWANDYFTVARAQELRDPSMLARGVTSNITGSRADLVICDDVEVPNTCSNEEKREALRMRLREMAYVLVSGGKQLYVGTPHNYYSIYADVSRAELDEEEPFLIDFSRLSLPLLNEKGESAWPERYSLEDIERLKCDTGPNKFDSQMMLKAINILNSRLDVELLQYYNYEIEYSPEANGLFLGHQKVVKRTGFWDPSMASSKGDSSVVAVVYADMGGEFYLYHVRYIKINPYGDETAMVQQCKTVAQIAKDFHLIHMRVEDNGLGKFLPDELRKQMAIISPGTSVEKVTSKKNKETRIVEAFDAILAAQRLRVHESVRATPFIREMREWKPGGKGCDDGLDAVAGALAQIPNRVLAESSSGKTYKAKSVLDD